MESDTILPAFGCRMGHLRGVRTYETMIDQHFLWDNSNDGAAEAPYLQWDMSKVVVGWSESCKVWKFSV